MVWDFGVSRELKLVEDKIRESITSTESMLTDIASYVIGAGGKRIRPTVTLLAYKALGGTETDRIVEIATAYELIHNATLLHDDINDGSSLRRGKIPAHKKWDVHRALVAGDYLFVKGFALGGKFDPTVVDITANACSKLAEGEIRQKNCKWKLDLSKEEYFETITKKTAMPIEAGAMVGAYLANGNVDDIRYLGDYGLNLGMAFQIVDDILDVVGDSKKLGKEIGTDLREGSITIPTLYALKELKSAKRKRFVAMVKKRNKTKTDLKNALTIIKGTGAVESSRQDAALFSEMANKALSFLKRNDTQNEMQRLIDYVLNRDR